jgi:hypothetical protein
VIAITIDLWPFGYSQDSECLSVIAIWNDGSGNRQFGNYKYRISHQFGTTLAQEAIKKTKIEKPTALQLSDDLNEPWVWKSGRIEKFERKQGAASLLAIVLKDAKL